MTKKELISRIEEIEEDLEKGFSNKELISKYNTSRSTMYEVRKQFGLVNLQRKEVEENGTKICKSCKTKKPITEFYSNGYTKERKFKYKPNCKQCEADLKIKNHTAKIKEILEQQGREFACELCGYNKNFAALHFHHVGEIKNFEISSAKSRSREALAKEISLCAILCANCHAELHHPLRGRLGFDGLGE